MGARRSSGALGLPAGAAPARAVGPVARGQPARSPGRHPPHRRARPSGAAGAPLPRSGDGRGDDAAAGRAFGLAVGLLRGHRRRDRSRGAASGRDGPDVALTRGAPPRAARVPPLRAARRGVATQVRLGTRERGSSGSSRSSRRESSTRGLGRRCLCRASSMLAMVVSSTVVVVASVVVVVGSSWSCACVVVGALVVVVARGRRERSATSIHPAVDSSSSTPRWSC